MTAHSYVIDVDSLLAYSPNEVQDSWGKVVREVRFKGRIAILNDGYADLVIMSREEYDRVMEALSAPSAATADPVVDLARRFEASSSWRWVELPEGRGSGMRPA